MYTAWLLTNIQQLSKTKYIILCFNVSDTSLLKSITWRNCPVLQEFYVTKWSHSSNRKHNTLRQQKMKRNTKLLFFFGSSFERIIEHGPNCFGFLSTPSISSSNQSWTEVPITRYTSHPKDVVARFLLKGVVVMLSEIVSAGTVRVTVIIVFWVDLILSDIGLHPDTRRSKLLSAIHISWGRKKSLAGYYDIRSSLYLLL